MPPTNTTQRQGVRRRRTPKEAEREILDAALELLREGSFSDLRVDELMARTTMSRPSFYVYFGDRNEIVLRLAKLIGSELFDASGPWMQGVSDPTADARTALASIVDRYAEHGYLLRAIAEASMHDPRVEEQRRARIERFVDAATARIEALVDAGLIPTPPDSRELAHALVGMTDRYLVDKFGSEPKPQPELAVDTLVRVWAGALLFGQ